MAAKAKRRAAPLEQSRISEAQARDVFAMFDTGAAGAVPVEELDLMLRSLGIVSREADVNAILHRAQLPADTITIRLTDFLEIIRTSSDAVNSDEEAQHAFRLIDTANTGFITFDALKAALAQADTQVSDDELKEVLRLGCLSGDKESPRISLADWNDIMRFIASVGP